MDKKSLLPMILGDVFQRKLHNLLAKLFFDKALITMRLNWLDN